MSAPQLVLFASRFLDVHAGPSIMKDPVIALVELVANAWDAGATEVSIRWPDTTNGKTLKIEDNGHGMTDSEFRRRWLTLSYDRLDEQGRFVEFPPGVQHENKRPAFGRNGIGRHAMFAFGDSYTVRTRKAGKEFGYKVRKGTDTPLALESLAAKDKKGHGTILESHQPRMMALTAKRARAEVGMRFLTDPSFVVRIDNEAVDFDDLPSKQIDQINLDAGAVGPISILVIDTRETDRTAQQHGVAWHVNGRLVGKCSWEGTGHERFLDGRRAEAKRYTFIVVADGLSEAVAKDWRRFDRENPLFIAANEKVQDAIRTKLFELTSEKRTATVQAVRDALEPNIARLSPLSRERWTSFVDEALVACPSISEKELTQLAGVLAKLEDTGSQYGLVSQLSALDTTDLDDLHRILRDWTLGFAKIVLDEVQSRLRLVDELQRKMLDPATKEVQELQPLFKRGLWIFGPEYETIEYTSNVGMTKVVQKLFNAEIDASRNRPDFAVLPDSSVGLYSYPTFDKEGGEVGTDRLVIIELKKPGVDVSTEEKGQAWKYVRELYDAGLLQASSRVTCFVLGSSINQTESGERTEMEGRVTIRPLHYDTLLRRAKSRMLKLHERVKDAPFLNTSINEFLAPIAVSAPSLELIESPPAATQRVS
jgi:hypothetical protein